ncbi:hypothetical protein ACWGDE_31590 [Streptomyces sp. NPDC054956]
MVDKNDQLTPVAFGSSGATESARADALRLLADEPALHVDWIVGLATNHSAPDSVVRRVFTMDPPPEAWRLLGTRELSPVAARTALAHPDPDIREIMTGNPYLPAEIHGALAEDAHPKVQRRMLAIAQSFDAELPVDVIVRVATSRYSGPRSMAAGLRGLPEANLLALTGDRDPRVRAAAVGSRGWPGLPAQVRAAAGTDPDPLVRAAFVHATRVEPPLPTTVSEFLAETDEDRRFAAVSAGPVEAAPAAFFVSHEDRSIRQWAARNPHLPTSLALTLTADPDPSVRLALSTRADLTEEQRAAIDYTAPQQRYPIATWVGEHFDDPDALREIAASRHAVLRRSVTCAPELPADVIERLATDEDHYVRAMLCENDHAPHELLLEMLPDSEQWVLLTSRGNFARPGLARFADDPNHRLRYASLRDPHIEPELVERLSHDPSDLVRHHAASHPSLPLSRLVELLGVTGQDMARTAARNPSLPHDLMHRLLDVAGVER